MSYKCFECTAPAVWERSTQFAGDHYYCDFHARSESDFNVNDSYACWVNLHEQQMNELVEKMGTLKNRVDNVLAGAEHVTDKGYELSTHEKQAEFEAWRNQDEDYDVVVDTLKKQRDILWKMTQQNMNADMFNIMDQIRLDQIDQLDHAIKSWKKSKKNET
jgi:hypothetical protein